MIINITLKPGGKAPTLGSEGAAGWDLYPMELNEIPSKSTRLISTGVCVELPAGYAGFVYERSSLQKIGLGLSNKVGLIDSDYRGEIYLALTNYTDYSVYLSENQSVAQLVIQKVVDTELHIVLKLGATERGDGGFGSTNGRPKFSAATKSVARENINKWKKSSDDGFMTRAEMARKLSNL